MAVIGKRREVPLQVPKLLNVFCLFKVAGPFQHFRLHQYGHFPVSPGRPTSAATREWISSVRSEQVTWPRVIPSPAALAPERRRWQVCISVNAAAAEVCEGDIGLIDNVRTRFGAL